LKDTGYENVGPGKFKGPDGKVVSRSELPDNVQQKLPGGAIKSEGATPKAEEAAKPEEKKSEVVKPPTELKSMAVEGQAARTEASKQIAIEKSEPEQNEPQSNSTNISPVVINQNSSEPLKQKPTIIVRNTDPTITTYEASIFDHPVVHPGIYTM
jgi:hypothetical protein